MIGAVKASVVSVVFFISTGCAVAIFPQPAPSAARRQVASYISSRQYSAALAQVRDLLKAEPRDASLWTLQGAALEGLGRSTESLASFDHAFSLDHSYLPALEGAAQTAYLHDRPGAMHYVQRVLAVDPTNPVAHAMAGALSYIAHDCGAAIAHFQQAGGAVLGSPKASSEFSDCLLKADRTQEAIDLLSASLARNPASHQVIYNLAVAQLAAHDSSKAIETLTSVSQPQDSDFLNLLAEAYVEADRPDDAFRILNDAIRVAPEREANYLDLAILCLEHNKEDMAVQTATAGIAKVRNPASLRLMRGVAYAQLGQYQDAEKDFTEASRIEPHQTHGTIAMSLLYSDRNEVDKEKQLLLHQLRLTPRDAVTNYLLADLLIRQGASPGQPAYDQAKAYLATSLNSKPDSVEAQILMSKVLEDEGDVEDSLTHLQEALKVEPANRTALYRSFILLQKMHRKSDAGATLARLKTTLERDLKKGGAGGQIQIEIPSSTEQ